MACGVWLIDTPNIPLKDISEKYSVSYKVVSHIAAGTSHTWLSKESPEAYAKLLSLKGTRHNTSNSLRGRGLVYPTVLSPNNKEYEVTHLTNFSKEHGLDPSSLSKLLRGLIKSHKKWTVK